MVPLWYSPLCPMPDSHCHHLRSGQLTRAPEIPSLQPQPLQVSTALNPAFSSLCAFAHKVPSTSNALPYPIAARKCLLNPAEGEPGDTWYGRSLWAITCSYVYCALSCPASFPSPPGGRTGFSQCRIYPVLSQSGTQGSTTITSNCPTWLPLVSKFLESRD